MRNPLTMFGPRWKLMPMLAALTWALLAAPASQAEPIVVRYDSTGPAQAIPDNAVQPAAGGDFWELDRNPGNFATLPIVVGPITPNTIEHVELEVAITHPFIGDLVIFLVHEPSGALVNLMSRPGLPFGLLDLGERGGDGSTLSDALPVRFSDDAAVSSESMTGGVGGVVGAGLEDPPVFRPSWDMQANASLSLLQGQSIEGEWTLFVGDASGGFTGELTSWSLIAHVIPEPGTAGLLLAAGGLLLLRRRPTAHPGGRVR